jgi:hypothetical protein
MTREAQQFIIPDHSSLIRSCRAVARNSGVLVHAKIDVHRRTK